MKIVFTLLACLSMYNISYCIESAFGLLPPHPLLNVVVVGTGTLGGVIAALRTRNSAERNVAWLLGKLTHKNNYDPSQASPLDKKIFSGCVAVNQGVRITCFACTGAAVAATALIVDYSIQQKYGYLENS